MTSLPLPDVRTSVFSSRVWKGDEGGQKGCRKPRRLVRSCEMNWISAFRPWKSTRISNSLLAHPRHAEAAMSILCVSALPVDLANPVDLFPVLVLFPFASVFRYNLPSLPSLFPGSSVLSHWRGCRARDKGERWFSRLS